MMQEELSFKSSLEKVLDETTLLRAEEEVLQAKISEIKVLEASASQKVRSSDRHCFPPGVRKRPWSASSRRAMKNEEPPG